MLCHNLTGERCSLCDYDLCCDCSKPLNTLDLASFPLLLAPPITIQFPAPGPALLPLPVIDMSHTGPVPAPSFDGHLSLSGPMLSPLPSPPLKDILHNGPALGPSLNAPSRNMFYVFDMSRLGMGLAPAPLLPPPMAPVPVLPPPILKMFPIFVMHKVNPPPPPVRPALTLHFVQNPNDPDLLHLPAWKPTVQPVPRGSRMKLTGLTRSMTPHVLKPLPSLNSNLVIVEQVD